MQFTKCIESQSHNFHQKIVHNDTYFFTFWRLYSAFLGNQIFLLQILRWSRFHMKFRSMSYNCLLIYFIIHLKVKNFTICNLKGRIKYSLKLCALTSKTKFEMFWNLVRGCCEIVKSRTSKLSLLAVKVSFGWFLANI